MYDSKQQTISHTCLGIQQCAYCDFTLLWSLHVAEKKQENVSILEIYPWKKKKQEYSHMTFSKTASIASDRKVAYCRYKQVKSSIRSLYTASLKQLRVITVIVLIP